MLVPGWTPTRPTIFALRTSFGLCGTDSFSRQNVMCALVTLQGVPNSVSLKPTLREQEVGSFVEVHRGIVIKCTDLLIRYLRQRAAEQVYQIKWPLSARQPTTSASLWVLKASDCGVTAVLEPEGCYLGGQQLLLSVDLLLLSGGQILQVTQRHVQTGSSHLRRKRANCISKFLHGCARAA